MDISFYRKFLDYNVNLTIHVDINFASNYNYS